MRVARLLSGRDETPRALANFDSTTAFVRALARYLRGEGFPRQGIIPEPLAPLLPAANRLPRRTRRWLYRRSGASEAVPPETLRNVDVGEFRRWVVDRYPDRGYPAVVVGSANGAAVHLSALLGVPWLPQTFLIPVRRSLSPDDPAADLAWGREPGQALLAANPDVQLHQMHDPNQDRLMVRDIAYFRVKLRRLGGAYERFLEATLAPGGCVVVLDCDHRWPTARVDDRHVFQFGGVGGLRPAEYHDGSDRVAAFLAKQGSSLRRWRPPEPDGRSPEAEWGFEPALLEDVRRFTDGRDCRVRRLAFDDPRDLSEFVAALYRRQYDERGFNTDRLLVQDFTLLDPWWTLRTGSVPYWLPFNSEPATTALAAHLEERSGAYDEIYATLFSNGVAAAGQASIDRWRALLEPARTRGDFVGVDPDAYPLDLGTYVRYHSELPETIRARRPLLPPLSVDEFEAFVRDRSGHHPVEWAAH